MSSLSTGLRMLRVGWRLWRAYVRVKRSFRKSVRAYRKALREGGLPSRAVRELVAEYAAMGDKLLSVLGRLTGPKAPSGRS